MCPAAGRRAASPLVTWELSVWISVGVTGYKQATVPDSHTPGSSALWATLDTHLLFPNEPAEHEQVCMCLCVLPPCGSHELYILLKQQGEQQHLSS